MHRDIAKAFKKYHLFGFTGTPIFAENAGPATPGNLIVTTPQRFGDQLHTYNIVDAINDGNVLPFKMTYNRTIHEKEDIEEFVPVADDKLDELFAIAEKRMECWDCEAETCEGCENADD
jgi:type I site-specific restriction-modification system R (restriction) subunit